MALFDWLRGKREFLSVVRSGFIEEKFIFEEKLTRYNAFVRN